MREPLITARATGMANVALSVIVVTGLALTVRAALPLGGGQQPTVGAALALGGGGQGLREGVYFGWVAGGESRFQLLGSPCGDGNGDGGDRDRDDGDGDWDVYGVGERHGDELLRVELNEASLDGAFRAGRVLPGSGVRSLLAEVDLGRAMPVIEFEPEVLATLTGLQGEAVASGLTDLQGETVAGDVIGLQGETVAGLHTGPRNGTSEGPEVAAERNALPTTYAFTHLKALCRSWRESAARIGYAAVMPITSSGAGPASPLEAHVVPVPDRTAIVALLLLWNRSAEPVELTSLWYAPPAAATGEVLVVNGAFEQYSQMQEALFRWPIAEANATEYEQHAAEVARVAPNGQGTTPPASDAASEVIRAQSTDLDVRVTPGGVALVGLTRRSFVVDGSAPSLLSYPVVDHVHAGRALRLAVDTPLYAEDLRRRPRGGSPPRGAIPAPALVLHSLFAASSPVGSAAHFTR